MLGMHATEQRMVFNEVSNSVKGVSLIILLYANFLSHGNIFCIFKKRLEIKSKHEENAKDGFEDHEMTLINCPFRSGHIVI